MSYLIRLCVIALSLSTTAHAQTETKFPSDIPEKFVPVTDSFDYVKRKVMIPMRDGVKLNTVIIVPKGAKNAPILLTRTPYNADELTNHASSSHLGPMLQGYDNLTDVIVDGGYIRVVQDVRGKYESEGDYVMGRPLKGKLNPTQVDHSTDTYDTIEWLINNIPESNKKVGIIGISYDGFLPLMALVNPHPALKVAVPMNPMVDGWMGDDWFHNGAFRETNMSYIYAQTATRKSEEKWFYSDNDNYDIFMRAVSAGELGRQRGLEQSGAWKKIIEHPAYDEFWREQAVDKILAKLSITVPTMLVHSLWDAEDIYGPYAVYKAIKPQDKDNTKVFLVMGPWVHGGAIGDGSNIGPIKFNSDTALYFRQKILRPFLDQYLKDGAPPSKTAPVTAFETGTNEWRQLPSMPTSSKALHLTAGLKIHSSPSSTSGYEEYISDPAKPVPYRARPIPAYGYDESKGQTWPRWLVDDQREASGRTDVLTFSSDVLTKPVKISGQPIVNLVASTSGTDSDWVVKIIDVYPPEVASQPNLGGYELMISADIFRGRYRESFEAAKPITANQPLSYRFTLPLANHVFLPGHKIMVQIQSSWFPLYDRNPQTFVPNIFWAKPEDYKKATQRVYFGPGQDSFIEMPIVDLG